MNTSRPFRLWFCPTTSNGPFYFSESPLLIFPSNKCHQFSGRYFQFRVKAANSVPLEPSEAVSGFEAIHPSLWPFDKIIGALGDRLCCFFFRFNNHSGAASEASLNKSCLHWDFVQSREHQLFSWIKPVVRTMYCVSQKDFQSCVLFSQSIQIILLHMTDCSNTWALD